MKRHIFILLFVLTFLLSGPQTLFCQENRGNAVPADALPEELQDLDVKDYFISFDAKEAGVIQTMAGHVVVIREDSGEAYFASPGDKIFERDTIFTLKKSRCRLKFLDDNLITMGDKTKIGIKEFIDDLELKEKRSVFSMAKGKAMFYALKLFRYKKASILVETPTAVAGVRGTKFGVAVRKIKGESVASRTVLLADASDYGWFYLAVADNGDTETIVYGFDGKVEVYSPIDGTTHTIGPGEMIALTKVGAGKVEPTPPDEASRFEYDTVAPTPEEEEEAGAAGPEKEAVDTTNVTQEQTTREAEGQGTTTTTKYGYFAAMLTHNPGVAVWRESYLSKSRQTFSSSATVEGWDYGDDYYMQGTGALGEDETSYITRVTTSDGDSGDLGTTVAISDTELGSNAYMEWGYWTATTVFQIGSVNNHYVYNRAYYVFGDPTTDLPTRGTATYTGAAYGTYWTSASGDDMMTGDFNSTINFVSGEITDFDINVTGGGHTATIENATGSFTSGTHFEIVPARGGVWEIDGKTADANDRAAYGSVYGPNAEAIGGVWGMGYGGEGGHYAVGIFQGTK